MLLCSYARSRLRASDHLPQHGRKLTRPEVRRLFAALTDLHRRFEGRELPGELADLRERISLASTGVVAGELNGADWLPKLFQRSWELVDALLPQDVAALVRGIDRDPDPIADALLARGRTLLHGDAGPSNVGFTENHVVLLDWQLASVGPGVVVDGPSIFSADLGNEVDNMEAIDAHVTPEGETVLTLVSDDNFSLIQRNLLLQFTLVE